MILIHSHILQIKALQYGSSEFETLYSLEQEYINELNNQQQIIEEMVLTEIESESPEQAETRLAKETNSNKQTSISTYLAKGDYINASSIMQELEFNYEADQNWIDMASISINLLQNAKYDWNFISSTQEQVIQEFALSSYSPTVQANARSILYLLYGTQFPLIDQNHSWNSSRKAHRNIKNQLIKTQSILNPYPNPTHNILNIPYFITTKNVLFLYDCFGKEIQKINLEKGYNTIKLETSHLSAGIYFIMLKDLSEQKLVMKKFIVQK